MPPWSRRFPAVRLYRDALALGYFHYQPNPDPQLGPVDLLSCDTTPEEALVHPALKELGLPAIESAVAQLDAGQSVSLSYRGDRASLAEYLIGRLSPETVLKTSFATSLHPSSVRPYRLESHRALNRSPRRVSSQGARLGLYLAAGLRYHSPRPC